MPVYGRRDLLDDHADVTERVRKLEVMRQSRVLIPKAWKPSNPALEVALGHAARTLGMPATTIGHAEPLSLRIMPEADYAADMFWRGDTGVDTDLLWKMWLACAVGPPYWSVNFGRVPGSSASVPEFEFITGAGQFSRHWRVFGPPFAEASNKTSTDVYVGADHFIHEGGFPDGATYMEAYPPVPLIDGTGDAIPAGGYYVGNQISNDNRTWSISSAPAACETPPRVDTKTLEGAPAPMHVPVSQAGCPNNPADPFGSAGEMLGYYYTAPLAIVTPHPQMGLPLDRMTAAEKADLGGPTVGMRDVNWSTLRTRLQLCQDSGAYASIFAWYESLAAVAQADLRSSSREGWQTLPFYPGWWGRVEVRYDNHFVTFRGRAYCGLTTDPPQGILAYPNHLPIGPRSGNVLPVHLSDGTPFQAKLDHSFRVEVPDDYLNGQGSYIRLFHPLNWVGLPPDQGDPIGYQIVFDGCRFPVWQGPFDGDHPPYPDLRV